MAEIFEGVNWLAVIVGLVLSMGLGFLWYNPKSPTGRVWAEGVGVGLNPPDEFPAFAMGMNTLGLFLFSWFVGVTAKTDALLTAILGTLAFGVLQASGGLFARATLGAVMVHLGYWFACLIIMVICQGLF